jgi:hypothetical protein
MLLHTMSNLIEIQPSVPEVAYLTYLVREFVNFCMPRHMTKFHVVASSHLIWLRRFIANCSHKTFEIVVEDKLERVNRHMAVPLHVLITTKHLLVLVPLPLWYKRGVFFFT